MSWNPEDTIHGVPRRPRIAEASTSTILWAIAGGLIAGPIGVVVGGTAGNLVANQRQPLEMAVREYLISNGLEVIFFYPAPRAAKVTFRDGAGAYWTVESVVPENLPLSLPDDIADWLYGNLVRNLLPQILPRIRRAS